MSRFPQPPIAFGDARIGEYWSHLAFPLGRHSDASGSFCGIVLLFSEDSCGSTNQGTPVHPASPALCKGGVSLWREGVLFSGEQGFASNSFSQRAPKAKARTMRNPLMWNPCRQVTSGGRPALRSYLASWCQTFTQWQKRHFALALPARLGRWASTRRLYSALQVHGTGAVLKSFASGTQVDGGGADTMQFNDEIRGVHGEP